MRRPIAGLLVATPLLAQSGVPASAQWQGKIGIWHLASGIWHLVAGSWLMVTARNDARPYSEVFQEAVCPTEYRRNHDERTLR